MFSEGVKKEHAGYITWDASLSLKLGENTDVVLLYMNNKLLDFLSRQVLSDLALISVTDLQKIGSPVDSVVGSVPWTSNRRWEITSLLLAEKSHLNINSQAASGYQVLKDLVILFLRNRNYILSPTASCVSFGVWVHRFMSKHLSV